MTNEITRTKNEIQSTFNGKRVRISKEDLSRALAPMFAAFPGLTMGADTFNAYYMMLCDLDPDKLVVAVVQACQAHQYPTQLVTVAAIREAYDGGRRTPGPRTDVDPTTLPDIPTKMFRLSEEDDRRERMDRLRRTRGWDKYYA